MRHLENKLVDHAIHPNGPTNQLQPRICRVTVYEPLPIEPRQILPSYPARDNGNVVHVGLVDHRTHCLLHGPRGELVRRVLVPYCLEIEEGPAQ